MDFGIAKIVEGQDVASATALHNQQSFKTRKGVVTGTPQYMSPEQVLGQPLDTPTDLFSLGSLLYTMCAGRPPFEAKSAYATMHQITTETPLPLP